MEVGHIAQLPELDKTHILVVGDVMLDKYIIGEATRISPEAPVPVIKVHETRYNPGGAANVAMNIAKLGGNVTIFGLCGNDPEGEKLKELLLNNGIRNYLLRTPVPTITKTRVVSKIQQMIRLDYEEYYELPEEKAGEAVKYLLNLFENLQMIIISDYGKGMVNEVVCRKIVELATQKNLPIIVDPKNRNWSKYRGAQLITPNLREFSEVFGREIKNEDKEIEHYGNLFLEKTPFQAVLVTRSEKGMSLITRDSALHLGTQAREVYDVSGAGDTVIAVTGALIGAGLSLEEAVRVANLAAGIVVSKSGTIPIYRSELEAALQTRVLH